MEDCEPTCLGFSAIVNVMTAGYFDSRETLLVETGFEYPADLSQTALVSLPYTGRGAADWMTPSTK